MRAGIRGLAFALCLAAASFGDNQQPRGVVFVHATDPHLFVPTAQDSDPGKKAGGDRQEALNQKALTDMFRRLQGFSGDQAPAFLVLTGDLGVDPCDIPQSKSASAPTSKQCLDSADPAKRNDQIERVAKALGASPLKEIYLVAGNNDIANEDPDDLSLGYFNRFIDDLQKKLNEDKAGVQLHNLTACYAGTGGSSSCYADISNGYRLIGFPSYSFKNKGGKPANNDEQAKRFETFRSLLDQARQSGKRVVILCHIPEIDDPFLLAQDRYNAKSPEPSSDKDPRNPRSAWSAWNIGTKLLDEWRDVLQSDTVVAVLAGHLHDSHKETYRQPYAWSSSGDHRLGFRKLLLAPPLAVKNQDMSPIQARGFSLVTLAPNHAEALLYWYNQETGEFNSDRRAEDRRRSERWWRAPRLLAWMWQLDQSDTLLLRLAILLIALLTAYLTVVAIWNIPEPDNPLTPAGDKTAGQKNGSSSAVASPFASDFGKTVIAGLAGLAVTEVAKALGGADQSTSAASRWSYIVWFIFFFFTLLFLLSFLRACAEGLRAMVAIPRYSLARPSQGPDRTAVQKFFDAFFYWVKRFLHWFFSLRVPFLTVFDTLINLIQGKNQTMTRVFADTIIDQQRNIVRVADAIRKDLTRLMEHQLSTSVTSLASPVRVGISVLSADQSTVFYISQSAGSARMAFIKRSVAWVAVFTGQTVWYESRFKKDLGDEQYGKIVLFDNSRGAIAGDEEKILLVSHYQPRQQDYQAFVVLPFPWPQRGYESDYVKGAIHISFRTDQHFEQIWHRALPQGDPPVYPSGQRMLEPAGSHQQADPAGLCKHTEICTALTSSLTILGELLRGFNEVIYRSYIEPTQRD